MIDSAKESVIETLIESVVYRFRTRVDYVSGDRVTDKALERVDDRVDGRVMIDSVKESVIETVIESVVYRFRIRVDYVFGDNVTD